MRGTIETRAKIQHDPRFQVIQEKIKNLQQEQDTLWKELNRIFPLEPDQTWALNSAGTIGIYSYDTD